MEGEKMIESLDSVWFFSNVLSSKKIQPFATFDADEDEMVTHKLGQSKPITQILETESLDSVWLFSNIFSPKKIQSFGGFHGVEDDLEESKPMSQVLEIHQDHNSPTDENLKPTFGNIEPRAQILEVQLPRTILGELGCEERRNRSKNIVKKKKRKNGYEKMKKNDDGEINWGGFDFGLGLIDDVDEFRMMMKGFDEENKRFATSQNLPPLNDGLAMKQHLKSWAYAVACNVR